MIKLLRCAASATAPFTPWFSSSVTDYQQAVIALGNFDGLHLGHRHVLATAAQTARECNAPLAVLTFTPHPQTVLRPGTSPQAIYSLREKIHILETLGVTHLLLLHFSSRFANWTATAFIETLLIEALQAKAIVTGPDFHFGKNRSGTPALLSSYAAQGAFRYVMASEYMLDETQKCSSTRIRRALMEGDMQTANHLLGAPYQIRGKVLHGKKLGKKLGIPTANLAIPSGLLTPRKGIYHIQARITSGTALYHGVASLSTNPTIDASQTKILLEVHLFDFSAMIYGEELQVSLLEFMRDEVQFPDLTALQEAMQKDINIARSKSAL